MELKIISFKISFSFFRSDWLKIYTDPLSFIIFCVDSIKFIPVFVEISGILQALRLFYTHSSFCLRYRSSFLGDNSSLESEFSCCTYILHGNVLQHFQNDQRQSWKMLNFQIIQPECCYPQLCSPLNTPNIQYPEHPLWWLQEICRKNEDCCWNGSPYLQIHDLVIVLTTPLSLFIVIILFYFYFCHQL